MNNVGRPNEALAQQPVTTRPDRLALYDQYGSVAYGVILQILPQSHLAQEVLVELFASSELGACQSQSSSLAVTIIQMARTRALAVKARLATPASSFPDWTIPSATDLPKIVFDLSFRQGCIPEQIAEQLQLSKADVLLAIHTYFNNLRQS